MSKPDNLVILAQQQEPEQPAVALEERDDDELMLCARGGRLEGFDVLVRRHQLRALTVATKYLGDPEEASDAVQNAFVELYRYLPRYRAQGKFTGLLARVVINQCRMAVRQRRTRFRVEAAAGAEKQPDEELADQLLIEREKRRDVERLVARLSPKLREVLVLRLAGGLSYQEIGNALDLRLGTVKSRLFSALAKLHKWSGEENLR
jgi:RNA polymerase sigma-70 factor (ECF subfamily)